MSRENSTIDPTRATELLATRYGTDPVDGLGGVVPGTAGVAPLVTETIATQLQHKSVRAFLSDPLPEGALEGIVAAAQSASTSSNQHLWSLVVVDDPEIKDGLVRATRSERAGTDMAYLREAPVVFVWVADASRNRRIVEAAGSSVDTYDYLDSFLMASLDAGLAAQNAAVAAESLGLGIVFLGALRNHADEAAELLNLPHMSYPVFGMAVGHPDPERDTNIRPRPSQRLVVHRNRYSAEGNDDVIDEFEGVSQDFRAKGGMSPKTWRDAVVAASRLDYMDGREQLGRIVRERGFGLT